MRNSLLLVLLLVILKVSFSCKNSKVCTVTKEHFSLDAIANKEIKKSHERKHLGLYSLCYSMRNVLAEKRKTIIEIDNSNELIIFESQKMNADVAWHTKAQLIVKEYPEIIKDTYSTEVFKYYNDVIKIKNYHLIYIQFIL